MVAFKNTHILLLTPKLEQNPKIKINWTAANKILKLLLFYNYNDKW